MRTVVLVLLITNLLVAGLGLAGVFEPSRAQRPAFDPEVPGFRGRLLELADDVVVKDPFPLLPATGQCFVATGFAGPEQARTTARRWLAVQRAVTPMRRPVPAGVTGVQVLSPRLPSRDDRVRLQQQLEQLGFAARLVAGGPYADRVSLGLFKASSEAESLRERLGAAGFDVELVEVRDTAYEAIVAGPIEDRPSHTQLAGLTIEERPCAMVAADYARF